MGFPSGSVLKNLHANAGNVCSIPGSGRSPGEGNDNSLQYCAVCMLGRLVMSNSCNPIDCSLPGFSVHGSLQARILEWVAISFSRGSSRPRNWTWVSCIASRLFTNWATKSTLAWEIPWTEEFGGLEPVGSQKSQTRHSNWTPTWNHRDNNWLQM